MNRKIYLGFLVLTPIIIIGYLILPLMKGKSPIRFGLDIAGGVVVSYRADLSNRIESYKHLSDDELLKISKEILSDRLYRKLKIDPDILIRDDNRIIVSIPSVQNYKQVFEIVGQTFHLTMSLVKEYDKEMPGKELIYYGGKYLELEKPTFSGDMLDISSIKLQVGDGSPKVAFSFRSPFNKKFEEFTKNNLGKKLAILLDDKIEVIGVIKDVINTAAVLSGGYTLEQAKDHAVLLRSGNLPISLQIESMSGIGPSLGQKVKDAGFTAVLFSIFLLLFVILIVYLHRSWFLLTGMISLFTLVISIAGFVAIAKITLDFGAIAGIILSVGMGMDSLFIIFESLETQLKNFEPHQIARNVHFFVKEIYSFSNEGSCTFSCKCYNWLGNNCIVLCFREITIFCSFCNSRVNSFALHSSCNTGTA